MTRKNQPAPGNTVPACDPFTARTAPTAVIPFRQAVELMPIDVALGGTIEGPPPLRVACVMIGGGFLSCLALDLLFEQTWNFQASYIADLHTTMALAPREEVKLELRTSQRKVLQQSVIDSAESLHSSEATTVDKDTLNVTRSSALTKGWHVDGSGSFSMGPVTLGASAGYSQSSTQSAAASAETLHEATKKSAQSLKTLHKVEVSGISDTLIEDKIVRRFRNPYDDRTLTLNVFQLLKRYDVATALAGTRPVLVFSIDEMIMDREFVLSNGGFLRATLLDADLLNELVSALAAARRPPRREREADARRVASDALRYLFEVPNIFNVIPLGQHDANDPAVSFDALVGLSRSGLRDAIENHAGIVFTTLNFFYRRYMDMSPDERAEHAVSFASALAAGTRPAWDALGADPDRLKNTLDDDQLTEALRRVSGFLAMVEGMLRPLLEPLEHEREAQAAADAAEIVIDRVVAHLHCLREYYVQRFLRYLVEQTAGVALPGFVRDVIARMQISLQARQLLLSVFDPRDAFLDRNEVVVPPRGPADVGQLVTALGGRVEVEPVEVEPIAEEIDVPFDGAHLEIAPGHCRLPDVPDRAEVEIGELSLKNLRGDCDLPA